MRVTSHFSNIHSEICQSSETVDEIHKEEGILQIISLERKGISIHC